MPADRSANEARFFFQCTGLPEDTFQVTEFGGTDRISCPYSFEITLLSSDTEIDPDDVINKAASLFIHRSGEYYPYSGIVSEFHFVDCTMGSATYKLTMVPRVWLLGLNRRTRVFQKMTVPDIIKQVLSDTNLSDFCEIRINKSYPEHEYLVQYQESDLNFISRLMEDHGIWYFFKENPLLPEELFDTTTAETMVISDQPSSFAYISGESSVVYRSYSGLNERMDEEVYESINRVQHDRVMIPKEVFLKNYNYRTPEVDLTGQTSIKTGNVGTIYDYGGDYKDTNSAQDAAKLTANRFAMQRDIVHGTGNCAGFRAGARYTLEEHFRSSLNTNFLLTEVEHSGQHTADDRGGMVHTYTNTFRGIEGSQAENYVPPKNAKTPKVNGVITAHIESNGSDYAALDDRGRYKVRFPFDLSDTQNYDASKYVRLAQPYSGANYGVHFPSHEGTEMVLACVDGDPNKPVGIGTVPNANTTPPVTSSNKTAGIIRTAGGNELEMDDNDGKQKVTLKSNKVNALELNDEDKRIALQTTDKNAVVLDDKNEKVSWNGKDHNITMDYGKKKITITSAGGHVISVDDDGKKITIQSNGGNIVEMDDNAGKITLEDGKGKNTVTLDGNKGLMLDSSGKISINASQDVEIKGANVKINASRGKIEGKAMQDLSLEGMNTNINATMNAKMEAKMNLEAKGSLGATIDGGLNTEIKGVMLKAAGQGMAEFSAGGMTTVKGAVVMIN